MGAALVDSSIDLGNVGKYLRLLTSVGQRYTVLAEVHVRDLFFFPLPFYFRLGINTRLGGCSSSRDCGILVTLQSQSFMIVGESYI